MSFIEGELQTDAMLGDQREVFEYWRALCVDGRLPSRNALRPASIVKRLPMVSLVELSACERRFRIRLAGTGLRDVFGEELTGRYVTDLKLGEQAAFWREVYDSVANGAPAQGYTRLAMPGRPTLIQAWLRLPLTGEDGQVSTILGYDRFLPLERLTARPRQQSMTPEYAVAM